MAGGFLRWPSIRRELHGPDSSLVTLPDVGSDVGVRLVRHVVRATGCRVPIVLAGAFALCAPPAPSAAAGGPPGRPGGATGHHGHRPGGQRSARQAARALLQRIALPAGTRAGGSPDQASPALLGPGSQPATPNLLDVHSYWHLPGDPDAAARWLHGHPPPLATIKGGSEAPLGIWWVRFAFEPTRRRFASGEVVLALARATDGGTLLRADAQVVLGAPARPQIVSRRGIRRSRRG